MSFPTIIDRVVVIVFENAELGTILNNGPTFKSLSQTYGFASNYFAACHPSAPNYLSMTCGATLQCGSDGHSIYSVKNVVDLINAAGLTWVAYMESMPSPCDQSSSGKYVVRHDPFVYYSDIVNGANNLCNTHVLPLSSFDATKTPPNFVWITPNLDNDGHDTGVAFADNWLKGFLPNLMKQPWAATTAFFIVFDEGSTSAGFNGVSGGHTYFCAISPISKGKAVTSDTTHYNMLTTIEYLLGLGTCGHNDNPTTFPPMKSLFQAGPTPLTVKLTVNSSTITLGQSVTFTATASGGTSPYAYSWSGMPTPCTGSNTPIISCIPNETGTFNVTVVVKDATNTTATATVTLVVKPPAGLAATLTINPSTQMVNNSVTFTVNVTGGTSPYTFAWTGLPTPCTDGNVSTTTCSPNITGTFNISVAVTDSASPHATVNATGTLTVTPTSTTELIVVTTPCTAIVYVHDQPRVIRWVHTPGTGATVKIELLKGGVLVKTISTSTPNNDALSWTVPTVTPGNDYQIKVTSLSNSTFSGISGEFIIQ